MIFNQTKGPFSLTCKTGLMGIIILLAACNSYAVQQQEEINKTSSQTSSPDREIIDEGADIQPEANRILKKMNDFMAGLKQFSFHGEITTDEILPSGQKLQFSRSVNNFVKRPDKFYVEIRDQDKHQEIFYDGQSVTLYGKRVNYYATIAAPSTIEETVQFLIDSVDVVAPAADLIEQNSYDVLMSDVESGFYVGLSEINGIECHHLAFRARETDWQIWIENSDTPVVRKFIITSKWLMGAPQVTAIYSDWNLKAKFSDDQFIFVAPEGARKIEFMPVNNANQSEE